MMTMLLHSVASKLTGRLSVFQTASRMKSIAAPQMSAMTAGRRPFSMPRIEPMSPYLKKSCECQPAALIDDGGLDERHGSVAAADTEDADLGKLEEELKIYHDRAPSAEFPVLHEDEADDAVDDDEQHDVDVEEHVGDEGGEDDRHGQQEARFRLFNEEVDGDL